MKEELKAILKYRLQTVEIMNGAKDFIKKIKDNLKLEKTENE